MLLRPVYSIKTLLNIICQINYLAPITSHCDASSPTLILKDEEVKSVYSLKISTDFVADTLDWDSGTLPSSSKN